LKTKIVALNSLILVLVLVLFAGTGSLCAEGRGVSISGMSVQYEKMLTIDLDTIGLPLPLSQENISLFLNGTPAESLKMLSKDNEKKEILYLVISIDSSRSISEKLLQKIKIRAKDIVREHMGNELIALYQFNNEVLLLNAFSKHKPDIEKSIDTISRHGNKTLLYNSLFDCIDLLQKTSSNGKSLIVFTDGTDDGSRVTADEVISLAKDAGIKVSFVSVVKNPASLGFQRKMSLDTGGVLLYIDDADIGPALTRLYSKDFIRKYTLSASIDNIGDEKEISVDVRIKSEDQRYRVVQSLLIPGKSAHDLKNIVVEGIAAALGLCLLVFLSLKYGHLFILKKAKSRNIRVTRSIDNEKHPDLRDFDMVENESNMISEQPAWLYRKDGQGKKEKFSLHSCGLTLGRSKSCGLIIEDPKVSSSHAQIRKEKDTYYLFDLVSEFGVFLNGKKILRPRVMHDWDEIQIGETVFIFREPKE
jgi:hypothetical protein